MTTWSEVDCFGCFVGGVAWRSGRISDEEIARFASSSDRWRRRAALVATIPLNAKSRGATSATGDAPRTLAVYALLLDDRDEMVVKAMSWALRELAKRDQATARASTGTCSPHRGSLFDSRTGASVGAVPSARVTVNVVRSRRSSDDAPTLTVKRPGSIDHFPSRS
jgi:hypothetical protein